MKCICETDFDFRKFVYHEINGELTIGLSSTLKIPEEQRMKYCPICAKKLTEENFGKNNKGV